MTASSPSPLLSVPSRNLAEENQTHRLELAHCLNRLLADTFMLYLMSRNFHWNIACPRYQSLHTLFEEHYHDLGEALDEIAARIRALGGRVAATLYEYQELSEVPEAPVDIQVDMLVGHASIAHQQAMRTAQKALHMAQGLKDVTTIDLLSELISMHEKCARTMSAFMPHRN